MELKEKEKLDNDGHEETTTLFGKEKDPYVTPDGKDPYAPPDGGWGWLVMVCIFYTTCHP